MKNESVKREHGQRQKRRSIWTKHWMVNKGTYGHVKEYLKYALQEWYKYKKKHIYISSLVAPINKQRL